MSDRGTDEDLAVLVGELVGALRELQTELEPRPPDRPPLPTPRGLRRFTSEVAIPGAILVLETNIRALRLLQRALRLTDGAEQVAAEQSALADRARFASETTLDPLDDVLAELQRTVEGRPEDDEAAALLAEARELRAEVERRLQDARRGASGESEQAAPDGDRETEGDGVRVDVDAELRSIKDELDEHSPEDPSDGTDDSTDDGNGDGKGGIEDGDGDGGPASDE